jgi:hypothetical protein
MESLAPERAYFEKEPSFSLEGITPHEREIDGPTSVRLYI